MLRKLLKYAKLFVDRTDALPSILDNLTTHHLHPFPKSIVTKVSNPTHPFSNRYSNKHNQSTYDVNTSEDTSVHGLAKVHY